MLRFMSICSLLLSLAVLSVGIPGTSFENKNFSFNNVLLQRFSRRNTIGVAVGLYGDSNGWAIISVFITNATNHPEIRSIYRAPNLTVGNTRLSFLICEHFGDPPCSSS